MKFSSKIGAVNEIIIRFEPHEAKRVLTDLKFGRVVEFTKEEADDFFMNLDVVYRKG